MTSATDSLSPPFATRFGERVVAARWPIITATLTLVAAAASGGMLLKTSTNYRMFFSEDNPQLLAFELLENTCGKNDNVRFMIVPEAGNFASEQALAATIWLTKRAWLAPHSRRVDSITNFQRATAGGDDLLVRDLVDPRTLGDADARARIRETALSEPRLAGNLVAATGLVIVFSVLVSMGLGGWIGLPFTPPTAPAPTIVLMVVVASCMHLLVATRQRVQAGDSKRTAIVESLQINLSPIFLASATTAFGFLTMNFSEVPPYRHLGTFVAAGRRRLVPAFGHVPARAALPPSHARPHNPATRPDDGGSRGVHAALARATALGVGRHPAQRAQRRSRAFF